MKSRFYDMLYALSLFARRLARFGDGQTRIRLIARRKSNEDNDNADDDDDNELTIFPPTCCFDYYMVHWSWWSPHQTKMTTSTSFLRQVDDDENDVDCECESRRSFFL